VLEIMNLETIIQEKVHALPPVKQAKVLAFVEDLESEQLNGQEKRDEESSKNEREAKRLSIIGMIRTGKTDTSSRVDEILAEGINKREGWSLP